MADITEKSNEFLLDQLDKALMSYGQADAVGAGKQKAAAKKAINALSKELTARGVILGYVREIQ